MPLFIAAMTGLGALAPAHAAVIDDVRTTGALNICTPADRKPFSFVAADGSLRGMDIELMQQLGNTLKVKVGFIQSSWAGLADNLRSGKCDIAVGGLPVLLDMQPLISYSAAYMVNGKTPLAPCASAQKYETLQGINRADVRVIEDTENNNEAYAKALLGSAKLTLAKDKNTVIAALEKGSADVFLTDSIDAVSIQKKHPALCAIHPDRPLLYGETAYMLPRGDMITKEYIDQWLHLSQANGSFQRVLERWIN